jgi:hypothetical protein
MLRLEGGFKKWEMETEYIFDIPVLVNLGTDFKILVLVPTKPEPEIGFHRIYRISFFRITSV